MNKNNELNKRIRKTNYNQIESNKIEHNSVEETKNKSLFEILFHDVLVILLFCFSWKVANPFRTISRENNV